MGPYACVRACVRVQAACVRVLSRSSGTAHAGPSLWRAAPQEREPAAAAAAVREQRATSSEQRGGRSTESAKAHTQTGIMEKRAALRRTLPPNGLRLLTSLLTLYGLTCELTALFVIVLLSRLLREVAVEA